MCTKRFENILKNACEDYDLNVRNFEDDDMCIMVCTFILGFVHGYSVDLKRPFYFDIPDKITGTMKYYRTTFNAAFSEIPTIKNTPKITEKDFKELLNDFDNIDLWKEKFSPNSFIFKGFGLINLFEVTIGEIRSSSYKTHIMKLSC